MNQNQPPKKQPLTNEGSRAWSPVSTGYSGINGWSVPVFVTPHPRRLRQQVTWKHPRTGRLTARPSSRCCLSQPIRAHRVHKAPYLQNTWSQAALTEQRGSFRNLQHLNWQWHHFKLTLSLNLVTSHASWRQLVTLRQLKNNINVILLKMLTASMKPRLPPQEANVRAQVSWCPPSLYSSQHRKAATGTCLSCTCSGRHQHSDFQALNREQRVI